MPGRPEDYEVLLTIGAGSYGRCRKVRRKADGKVRGGGRRRDRRGGGRRRGLGSGLGELSAGVRPPAGAGVEGAGLRLHDGGGEADARFGGEPAAGAAAPQHRALPRPHHRQEQHDAVHRHGVLRRRGPGQPHRPLHQGKARGVPRGGVGVCRVKRLGQPKERG